MQFGAHMAPGNPIDREKHDVDVMEHVSLGVHADQVHNATHLRIVDLGTNTWFGADVVSAVRVEVIDESQSEDDAKD